MTTKELTEIIAISNEATNNERDRCLKAVDDEPEVPGTMPDEMWNAIRDDRNAVENAIRIAVHQTKAGIRERILGGTVLLSHIPTKAKSHEQENPGT